MPARRGQIFKASDRTPVPAVLPALTPRLWLTQLFIPCCALITAHLSTLYLARALIFVSKVCVTYRRPRQKFSGGTANANPRADSRPTAQ